VTTVYLLVSTAVVPVMAALGAVGAQRVFLVGIAMFLLGSALAGASHPWTSCSVPRFGRFRFGIGAAQAIPDRV